MISDYVLTDRTTQSVVQKPHAMRVRLELKYGAGHFLKYNSEVQANKIEEKGLEGHKVYHIVNGYASSQPT